MSRVGGRQGHVSEGAHGHGVEDVGPLLAPIGALPEPAGRCGHPEDGGVRGERLHIVDPSRRSWPGRSSGDGTTACPRSGSAPAPRRRGARGAPGRRGPRAGDGLGKCASWPSLGVGSGFVHGSLPGCRGQGALKGFADERTDVFVHVVRAHHPVEVIGFLGGDLVQRPALVLAAPEDASVRLAAEPAIHLGAEGGVLLAIGVKAVQILREMAGSAGAGRRERRPRCGCRPARCALPRAPGPGRSGRRPRGRVAPRGGRCSACR